MKNISQTKNQHFIPRFLIRNFAWCINPEDKKKKRHKYKTNFFPEKGLAESKNINNIASDDYFYEWELKGEVEIEEELSKVENRYAATLSLILNRMEIQKSQFQSLSNFVFNLSWRTENNRALMNEFLKNSFEEMAQETMEDSYEMSKINKDAANNALGELNINVDRNVKARAMVVHKLFVEPEVEKQMAIFIKEELPSRMGELTADTQAKLVIKNDLSAHDVMSRVTWNVFEADTELILGDGGPIAYDAKADVWGPLFWMLMQNKVDLILLPISPKKFLLGTPTKQDLKRMHEQISGDKINTLQARQCYKFFVCQNLEIGNAYLSLIGATHVMYTKDWSLDSLPFYSE
jgi:hypothetical protein